MSDNSPLFVSAMELIAHATELYTQGNDRKYKFVILHLANAVELILKDRLIDKGVSIYKTNTSQTIGIWDAFKELRTVNINIPERPVIELLNDDRNTIQYRFGFPNPETVFYYLEQTITFFKRFLDEEYGIELADVLKLYPEVDLSVLRLVERQEDEYASLNKLLELSPEAAVLQAFSLVESKFLDVIEPVAVTRPSRMTSIWRHPDFPHLMDDLAIDGFISHDTAEQFPLLRDIRNRAAHIAHFQHDELHPDWALAISVAKDLLVGLDKAIQEDYSSKRKARRKIRENGNHDDEVDNQLKDNDERETDE